MINDYLTYVLLAIAVTAIPGPAVILTIQNSLKYGYKISIINIFGNFVAMIILASISAVGLGAIILSSALLFSILKFLGCFYLIYLGIKIWNSPNIQKEHFNNINQKSSFDIFKEGFTIGISNPKAIAFFTALFPQFIDPTREYFLQFTSLILTIEGISFLILLAYAMIASFIAPYMRQQKAMNIFNKLTGISFIGFGTALVYKE